MEIDVQIEKEIEIYRSRDGDRDTERDIDTYQGRDKS